CALGSVKTNIGHLEGAAGVAGLIKAVLAFEHEQIPKHLHFRALNPHIALEGTPFVIPTAPFAWPRGAKRRIAGVSSFGMSGTNAHVVIEEPPSRADPEASSSRAFAPLLVSARDLEALRAQARAWADWLEAHDAEDVRSMGDSRTPEPPGVRWTDVVSTA